MSRRIAVSAALIALPIALSSISAVPAVAAPSSANSSTPCYWNWSGEDTPTAIVRCKGGTQTGKWRAEVVCEDPLRGSDIVIHGPIKSLAKSDTSSSATCPKEGGVQFEVTTAYPISA